VRANGPLFALAPVALIACAALGQRLFAEYDARVTEGEARTVPLGALQGINTEAQALNALLWSLRATPDRPVRILWRDTNGAEEGDGGMERSLFYDPRGGRLVMDIRGSRLSADGVAPVHIERALSRPGFASCAGVLGFARRQPVRGLGAG
jgi:hypothetical protein